MHIYSRLESNAVWVGSFPMTLAWPEALERLGTSKTWGTWGRWRLRSPRFWPIRGRGHPASPC